MNSNPKISVIIPVYNVYEYIDQCLKSVIGQSFTNFEVILINDGSTDGSDRKCEDWAGQDTRIRYISKGNEGLYKTWNLGISLAQGDYLSFVDSDDWLDNDFLLKLYDCAQQTGADIVECDFWRYNNNTHEKTCRTCYGSFGVDFTKEERMSYAESTLWKFISKRAIWQDNHIEIPNCRGASHAVYFLFLALGASVASVREPLYFYRRLRKGSIIEQNGIGTLEAGKIGVLELDELQDELMKRNLYTTYSKVYEKAVKYRLSDFLAGGYLRRDGENYLQQERAYQEYVENKFPNGFNYKYLTLGGYNLNRILSYLPVLHSPYCRFNFSSIISIMNPAKNFEFEISNVYRKKMICRDIQSSLWTVIDKIKPKYLFIDFIDERFNVIQLESGGYITESDAFKEVKNVNQEGRIIYRNSEECMNLWKTNCMRFFEKIKKYVAYKNIFVIESYLSKYVGNYNEKRLYRNAKEIEEINVLLKCYYAILEEKIPQIRHVKAYEENYYYTDENYEHGSIPSHLNEYVNKKIANNIYKALLLD